jgi:dTDP-4-amino-4,6-dideoxygalactose transaminase
MDPAIGGDVNETLLSGFVAQGPKVEQFEAALEPWMGRKPVTVNSGTSALTLALRLAGVGRGDKVVTTPMTCSATNLPILSLGAEPVWADIDPRTGLIDPRSVADRIDDYGHEVKAVMAVDWGGQPADYGKIFGAVFNLDIPVIEDAAHAFGAEYMGDLVGSIADYTCFSFQAIKHLTTGDGGALTTSRRDEKRARTLRWFGIDREASNSGFRGEVDIKEWGYKFHMNDIAATIGLANLALIDKVLMSHRSHALMYDAFLDKRFTRTQPEYDHVGSWWIYTILLPDRQHRDEFKAWMDSQGVQVSQVHWRNDTLSVFKTYRRDDLPGVDSFSERMICLPAHQRVNTIDVINAANRFWDR